MREFREVRVFAADLTDDEAAALRRSGDVRYVEPALERHLFDAAPRSLTPATRASQYRAQVVPWGIDAVRARELWPLTRGLGNVNVAVFDTGVDAKHPDLGANVAGMYNTLTKSETAADDNNHGTHVAGTIAALDNGIGVVGVAPLAKIWAVKVLNNSGSGTIEQIVAGVEWVIGWKRAVGGNWIASFSLGAEQPSLAEQEALQRLAAEGVLIVAATGNDSRPSLSYPAAYPMVLAVGATDGGARVPLFSNGGAGMGIVAPGVNVASTVRAGTVAASSAHVDGAEVYASAPLAGSGRGDVEAGFVYCGYGGGPSDFPPSVRGNIALIQRGALITFADKAKAAKEAGAAGVLIFNNDDSQPMQGSLIRTADDLSYEWPVTVGISNADGQKLLARGSGTLSIGSWIDDYDVYKGTSMAAPHVAGVAALLWTLAPKAKAVEIQSALLGGARDVGDPGYDLRAGWGLVDAVSSAKILMPQLFGLPAAPPPPLTRRRAVRP